MGSQARLDHIFGKANLNPFSWILTEILPSNHTCITNSIGSSFNDFQMDGFIESSKFKLRMVFKNLILRLIFFSENAECPLTSSCAYSANEWHIDPPQRSSALCRTEHICSKANLSAPSFQQGCVKVPRKNQQQLASVTWNHCSTWASWRLRNDLGNHIPVWGEVYTITSSGGTV